MITLLFFCLLRVLIFMHCSKVSVKVRFQGQNATRVLPSCTYKKKIYLIFHHDKANWTQLNLTIQTPKHAKKKRQKEVATVLLYKDEYEMQENKKKYIEVNHAYSSNLILLCIHCCKHKGDSWLKRVKFSRTNVCHLKF